MSAKISRSPRATSVLVTAAGGSGSIEIIKSLRARNYRVLATDCSEYAAGFAFADRGWVVPPAVDPEFVTAIGHVIDQSRPDFVAPFVDEEIPVLLAMSASRTPSFRVVAPTPEFCALALDKWLTFAALSGAAIPTPRTCLASDPEGMRWPAVLKPRDGRGGREVAYLDSVDALRTHLAQTRRSPDAFVLQEQILGTEFTVSAVVGLGGPMLGVVSKEVITKKGITLVGVTRKAPAIDRLCHDIQDRLHASGPFNVQLIVDEAKGPQVIEINPRYSTTVALTIAAGVDEVDVVIQHALGRSVGPLAYTPDLLMVRHHAQVYVPEQEWLSRIAERVASA